MYQRGGAAVGSTQTGIVKSWNGGNGYGFIECPGAGGDIMFLRTALPPDCKEVRGKFLDGKQVQFEVQTGNNGKTQAANIQIHVNEGDFLAGRIKTFSDKNGYGFIESSMMPGQDVRFNTSDFQDLLPGVNLREQLVIFQVMSTPDGKQRVSKIMFQSSKIAQNLKAGFITQMGNQMGRQQVIPQMGGVKRPAGAMANTFFGSAGNKGGFKKQIADATGSPGGHSSGIIKSYNTAKGFGFITADGLPSDVFFMRTDLPAEAQNEDCNGCGVYFEIMNMPDGKLRASNITSHDGGGVDMTANSSFQGPANSFGGAGNNPGVKKQKTDAAGSSGGHSSGIIKSYNVAKGFGFITADGLPSDVFFMKTDLPAEAQGEDCNGCGVYFEVMNMPDGKMRARNISSV